MGNGSLSPGVKRPWCGADEPPPSGAEVKETVPLLSLCVFMAYSIVKLNCTFNSFHVGMKLGLHALIEELGVLEKFCGGKYLALKRDSDRKFGKRRGDKFHNCRST